MGDNDFDSLKELALDMRWSWNHAAHELWSLLDPVLWDLTHNPWVVLQSVSTARLEQAFAEPGFRTKVDSLFGAKRRTKEESTWFERQHGNSPLKCAAYFSMEFMLSEALPIYSGGLGNVAGDQLKAAGDLGVPVVGVGLLYQQGYFRQEIGSDGAQQALYPYNDPGQLPITRLQSADGDWLRLEVKLPGYSIWLRAWQVQVGRVKLYLLDSNDSANYPAYRGITTELYGGDSELRLRQELILGIGGWRLLNTLGLRPEVCHLNEGHAAFAVLERAREYMEKSGEPFDAALAVTRAGNIFTTHTAVPAGFDRFSPGLMARYVSSYAVRLGIAFDDLMALGRLNPCDSSEPFNMAYLAIRGSGAVNGVSSLHGEVSRRIFTSLFPRWPEAEVPIGHITNGIHVPSWESDAADELWAGACGADRWQGESKDSVEQGARNLSNAALWQLRTANRIVLIDFARDRLARQLSVRGESEEARNGVRNLFDPRVLTIGFARRFAAYKRPNLLLHDPDRLLRLLTNSKQPVQLIIAGKAHPADEVGQQLIQQWMQFIMRPGVRQHVIFLTDYDMLLAEQLVRGVDLWINTPQRPWEASGTSGMKVLANGGINLSELDGWWAEAYTPEVGWAIGDGKDRGDDPSWDAAEAHQLYNLLEREVVPQFYTRNENDIPTKWVDRIRESLARLTPRFSADRAVREYTEQHYLPAAAAYAARAADRGAAGRALADWRRSLDDSWSRVHFGAVNKHSTSNGNVFEVEVCLDNLDPNAVRVELYADGNGIDSEPFTTTEMKCVRDREGSAGCRIYSATVPANRPAFDYTARIIPHHDGAAIPLEAAHILWQR